MEKIFVDKKGIAVFTCPHCGFVRTFDASGYREKDSRIKIKCRCGESVPVLIEFREYYRKQVNLAGQCYLHRTKEVFQIRVQDLSLKGVCFFVLAKPGMEDSPLLVDDVVTIQFRLDNPAEDVIERRALVKNVKGLRAGANFTRTEYDKELGFYLMR